jgi:proteasome accessory factor B
MTYTDAAGKKTERLVAPYGFYGMRGSLYMVAPSIDDGSAVEGSIRVYNVSRVDAANEDPETIFSVPKDFSVGDYRRLPFQFGPTTCVAAFEAPACSVQELEGVTLGRGRLVVGKNAVVWTVDVSDVGDAASWAIASGIRPTAPRELVDEWRKRLEKVSAHVC